MTHSTKVAQHDLHPGPRLGVMACAPVSRSLLEFHRRARSVPSRRTRHPLPQAYALVVLWVFIRHRDRNTSAALTAGRHLLSTQVIGQGLGGLLALEGPGPHRS